MKKKEQFLKIFQTPLGKREEVAQHQRQTSFSDSKSVYEVNQGGGNLFVKYQQHGNAPLLMAPDKR